MSELQLPEGWVWRKLEDVCNILDSQRRPINNTERQKRLNNTLGRELYPYYGATGQVGLIDEYLLEGEFILLGEDGAPFLELFKPKAYLVKGRIWVNNHAHILEGKPEVLLNHYLKHYLNRFKYDQYVNGTTRLKLTQGRMKEIPVPLPPLFTQHQIVARIEELFSELDAGVKELQTALSRLKTYRQAVLHHYLNNPDWERVKLGEVAHVSGGLTKNSKRDSLPLKMPYLRVANVYADRLDLTEIKEVGVTESEVNRTKLRKNDLLVVEGNGSIDQVGRVAIWNGSIDQCLHQNHLIKIRFNEPQSAHFILKWLLSPEGRRRIEEQASSTSGLHTLSISKLANLSVPLTDIATQTQIVSEIETRLSEADVMETTIRQELIRAENLRQSILKQALEGKLVTSPIEQNVVEDPTEVAEPSAPAYGGQAGQLNLF